MTVPERLTVAVRAWKKKMLIREVRAMLRALLSVSSHLGL
jgi:hypothetical protein